MQDLPPYSFAEIQVLISQYLDQALSPQQEASLLKAIDENDAYQAELHKQEKAKQLLKTALQGECFPTAQEKTENSLWQKIQSQLQVDTKVLVHPVEFEAVSAYYDGELNKEIPQFEQIETQLFANQDLNQMLSRVSTQSEAIRQMGYRLEESCSLDISKQVMQAFLSEAQEEAQIPSLEQSAPLSAMISLSCYVDGELTPREVIETNRLIEQQPGLKQTFQHFSQISEGIQSVSEQIQSQIEPNCWPVLQEKLQQELNSSHVIPLRAEQPKKSWALGLKYASSIAAVGLLLALGLQPDGLFSVLLPTVKQAASSNASVKPQQVAALSKQAILNTVTLASVTGLPQNSPEVNPEAKIKSTLPDREALAPTVRSQSGYSSKISIPGKARFSGTRRSVTPLGSYRTSKQGKILALSQPVPSTQAKVNQSLKTPSSEEYLFKALNEQMPGGDVSSFLGN